MQIIIHRGIDQIGGCITEISADNARIFVDMGDNLPGNEKSLTDGDKAKLVSNIFDKNKQKNVAVFYTHSHPDHVGMMNLVPENITQYMSQGTYDILRIKEEVLQKKEELENQNELSTSEKENKVSESEMILKRLDICKKWQRAVLKMKPSSINIGNICVTPYFVSHSTYDAYMLLIEVDGKKILHTGDYRGHGYLSKGLLPTIKHYIGQVDYLITEGTMLGRRDECVTEGTISQRMYKAMINFKYVFVLVSSTDVERLASINIATKKQKRMLVSCSLMHNRMLEYFRENVSYRSYDLFDFQYYKYSPSKESIKLIAKMRRTGFTMVVGPSQKEKVKHIMEHFDASQTLLIYSTWDGYYKLPEQVLVNTDYKDIRSLFQNVIDIHTSGHASISTITDVINAVCPREGIIGIHKDANTSLTSLKLSENYNKMIIPDNKQIDCVIIK